MFAQFTNISLSAINYCSVDRKFGRHFFPALSKSVKN
jgi:hypothetical protein